MLYVTSSMDKPPPNRQFAQVPPAKAKEWIEEVKNQFLHRYGHGYADQLLENGVQSFGSLDATALRMVEAAQENRPFVIAFSGYSITVGRGNFFNQSFPFVLEEVLEKPMRSILGIPLVVRNAAIGGIPSFPYGFCLEHFLGADPDVIGWDYSMNEGPRDSSVLEAFIRHATQQLHNRPMLIMLDRNAQRTNLLEKYTSSGYLQDAIAVSKKEVIDEKVFKQNPIVEGFQDWDEFGAPRRCPGRGSWHPKRQEHSMIGWLMAMHFLKALERAYELQQSNMQGEGAVRRKHSDASVAYGKPLSPKVSDNDPRVTEILYGHEKGNGEYTIGDLSCRTSFLPATDNSKVLPSLAVSGFAEGELDIMIDRTDDHYKEGWVLDVSKVERDTKRKVERCGGLGYVDMKIALYGIPDSGKLRLWLPYEGSATYDESNAKKWFENIILCEANEKRSEKACQLNRDLTVVIDGEEVSDIQQINGAAEYLKRQTCVSVAIPENAKVASLGSVRSADGRPLSVKDKEKFGRDDNDVGLIVDLTAKSTVTRQDGACCISHVVWEQYS
ncbi:MAG: hypothetical protein SGBAC_000250 [Bacillariaceae sp.]